MNSPAMRAAIFFTPPPDHPLTAAAARWLGRDAFSGAEIPQASVGGFGMGEIRDLTAFPRRYGFHATLKPPFRLVGGRMIEELDRGLEIFSRGLAPIRIRALRIERIGSFFALTPSAPIEAVDTLAADVVQYFDPFRAPPSAEEIQRRRPEHLTASQRENLRRWGYPFVFRDFRFHMTLTGEVPEAHWHRMGWVLEERFGPLITEPLTIDSLSLFVEPAPPGDFVVRLTAAMSRAPQPVNAA